MNIARLEKRDPAKNMARSYRIWVTPTLFGSYAVVREWGRIGSPGTVREEWFESEEEAIHARLRLCRRKERRGYSPLGRGQL
jgi:predicted DNA-binding WGR domain protein